ncbi:MAG: tetratricopeptide repeat protein [Alcaligenaceae bacterium]|nr:MAG: tetratricopeptide repeat protein [Alcaligenaceae bacterium]
MLRALKSALGLGGASTCKSTPDSTLLIAPPAADDEFFRLGNAAVARENFAVAAEHYACHVARNPQAGSGYVCLGFALSELGRWSEAIDSLNQALTLDPDNADGLFLLGRARLQSHEAEAAEQAWNRAHALAPDLEALYGDHCFLLFSRGKIDAALSLIETGIARFPQNSDFRFYLGNLLAERGDFAPAVRAFNDALALGNESASVYSNLGTALVQIGDHESAIEMLKKAQDLAPDSALAASNYLLSIQYTAKLTKAEKFAVAQAFAERFENPLITQWGNYRQDVGTTKRRMRIGYVSGDLRNHALAFFFEPIIACHDKARFEVFCYYTHPEVDHVSRRIRASADHWLSCHGMSDEALAAHIRGDEIDVLVDLSGHTGHNRLLTFARKPAPVQMTWLGYQATTGLRAMDYRITDEALDPTGTSEHFHSEQLIRLPASGTFNPSSASPPVNKLPALSGRPFTFGCLNNPSKITNEVLGLWARILIGNSEARLMIGNSTPALMKDLSAKMERCGVDSMRLLFVPKVSLVEYLTLHHQIDLALDTFPYNGGTTTFHSLWMGVPIVALEGDSTLSKVGTSLMRAMGLNQFCADTAERYVELALFHSNHLAELNQVRLSLRETMKNATQDLSLRVTRSLEEAMQSCLDRYRRKSQTYVA